MGLDEGVVVLGKHVLSFTKPKVLGGVGGGNSLRQLTAEDIVRVIHWEFNPVCGLLKLLKPCGMGSDELVPLTIYSLLRLSQPAAKAQTAKGQAEWV